MSASWVRMAVLAGVVSVLAASSALAMSEDELKALYLDVVETAVPVFEPIWKDDSERVPGGGYFEFQKYGNWRDDGYCGCIVPPGNGMICFCYAVLLTQTDKEAFGPDAVPRSVLEDHAVRALRWLALTNSYAEPSYPYAPYSYGKYYVDERWTRPKAFRADMLGWISLASAMLWDDLDAELKAQLSRVFVGESAVGYEPFTWSQREGGLHDCVKHYLASQIGAAFLCPDHEQGKAAMDLVRQCGIDVVATWHNRACTVEAEGKPVKDWVKSWNLYPDYSSDHHAHAQIWYGCDLIFEARSYIQLMSHLTGLPVPGTYTYEGNGFDGVLEWVKRISSPEGEPIPVQGTEYDSYYGAALLAFCYGSVLRQDPVAAALEERSAKLLQHQSAAVRQYDYHRNSWAKAAVAYLMHCWFGPRVEPLPQDEAQGRLEGVYHHADQLNLIHRGPDKWVSWVWGIQPGKHVDGHCGMFFPANDGKEPLVYAHANTLVGRLPKEWMEGARPGIMYDHTMRDDGFASCGVRESQHIDQHRAVFSFDDGPMVVLTRFKAKKAGPFSWTGAPVFFYVREGVTGARTLYDATGSCALGEAVERTSPWWCVDDRLGLVSVGGNNTVTVERQAGLNWARIPEYRDQCDAVRISPVSDDAVEAGGVPVDLAVAVYANVPHAQVGAAAGQAVDLSAELPAGWKGLVAADGHLKGKRYIALARFGGHADRARLELAFDEGAPVLSCPVRVEGGKAFAQVGLDARGAWGESVELYAQAAGAAAVTRLRLALYRVEPCGEPVEVSFMYAGAGKPRVLVRAGAPKELAEPTEAALDEGGRHFSLRVTEPMLIELVGPEQEDHAGPAVEIAEVKAMPDGLRQVCVAADDRNGLSAVRLTMDGEDLGERTSPPYEWVVWPEAGFHTFEARAVDDSPNRNARTSYKRTVEVKVNEPVN